MHTVTNLFILNLAIIDIVLVVVCVPPKVVEAMTETWYLGTGMCRVVHYVKVSD